MSKTRFAGTLQAGPIGAVGKAVLAQVYDSGDMTGLAQGNYDVQLGVLPAGAEILDIAVDQVVAAGAGTTTVSVGTASGGAQLMAGVATTAGGRFRGVATAATQLAWQGGDAAQSVWVRNVIGVATLTAGRLVVTVQYVQK